MLVGGRARYADGGTVEGVLGLAIVGGAVAAAIDREPPGTKDGAAGPRSIGATRDGSENAADGRTCAGGAAPTATAVAGVASACARPSPRSDTGGGITTSFFTPSSSGRGPRWPPTPGFAGTRFAPPTEGFATTRSPPPTPGRAGT